MNPKEKAYQLLTDIELRDIIRYKAKKISIILVNEIIKSSPNKPYGWENPNEYWKEVKNEINKL